MATTFLEPGGDADFLVGTTNGFWTNGVNGTPIVVTDFVHGNHIKSIKLAGGATGDQIYSRNPVLTDTGNRISFFIYIVTLPTAAATICSAYSNSNSDNVVRIRLTSLGVLQLFNTTVQIGIDGSTLSTGVWYRISLAYTITSTTVNRFELFKNGISDISITNTTLESITADELDLGNLTSDGTLDIRLSDIYVDNSSSLTDTGNIWVTAKRPVSNGTTNGFTTQIGSGGSGYGTGHSPQVNERPLSTTNGWSMVGAGSAITEEYNIEAKNVGDIDISAATIVDWLAWWSMKALAGETLTTIFNGSTSTQAITTTATLYTKIAGSTTYPAGTGADVGITTTTALTTVSLYECGVVVAYIPAVASASPAPSIESDLILFN